MSLKKQMAYQSGNKPVTQPAPGDAPATGNPGPTPPPVERERSFGRENYGSNAFDGRVVNDPGERTSSPLADALEAKQHSRASDALTLEHIRQHGTARDSTVDLASAQTRKVDDTPYPTAVGHHKASGGSPSGTVPTHCGAPVNDD